jgi:hypothetical protein
MHAWGGSGDLPEHAFADQAEFRLSQDDGAEKKTYTSEGNQGVGELNIL